MIDTTKMQPSLPYWNWLYLVQWTQRKCFPPILSSPWSCSSPFYFSLSDVCIPCSMAQSFIEGGGTGEGGPFASAHDKRVIRLAGHWERETHEFLVPVDGRFRGLWSLFSCATPFLANCCCSSLWPAARHLTSCPSDHRGPKPRLPKAVSIEMQIHSECFLFKPPCPSLPFLSSRSLMTIALISQHRDVSLSHAVPYEEIDFIFFSLFSFWKHGK